MKKDRVKDKLLEELRKIPVVQVACEKCGVSRNSFYKWKRQSKKFSVEVNKALEDGEAFVNDMSESQLLQLIKEKSFSAIRFWLNSRHPKFKKKVEIEHNIREEKLTPEQEEIVRRALSVLTTETITNDNKKENE